ncbi:Chloroperoxidase [Cristinia sonorae]|uniref:Chloroperoxidase n=1 Tax=Cristinia sonorae TaxID=1940300 RepID=A0A8K0XT60_9AGAR|nr:Chloroperoxidase [Cristinia sonorae]
MLSIILVLTALAAGVFSAPGAQFGGNHWVPAGPDDSRSPCPVLNMLANHDYIPHNGKNLTPVLLNDTLKGVLGLEDALADMLVTPLPIILKPDGTFQLEALPSFSTDGKVLTPTDFAKLRVFLEGDKPLPLEVEKVAAGEPSLILSTFGTILASGDVILPLDLVDTIFGLEMFPPRFTRSAVLLSNVQSLGAIIIGTMMAVRGQVPASP